MMQPSCSYSNQNLTLVLNTITQRTSLNEKEFSSTNDVLPVYKYMDVDGRKHELKLWRKKIYALLNNFMERKIAAEERKFESYQKDIDELFSFLPLPSYQLFSLDVATYLEEIKQFIESLGSLSDIININGETNMYTSNSGKFVIHVYLDLYCSYMKFLSMACRECQEIGKELRLFVTYLLKDLVDLSHQWYNQQSRKENALKNDVHPCKCFQDIWCIVISILDSFNNVFWSVLSEQFAKRLESDGECLAAEITFQASLLLQIAPSYWNLSATHREREKNFVPANWIYFQELLKKSYTFEDEVVLQTLLHAASLLIEHWNVDNDILNTLWDYFAKRLNFQWQYSNYKHFKTFTKVELDLQEKFNGIISLVEKKDLENPTIFDLFLRFLHRTIKRASMLSNEQYIATTKRKIFSKYHKKQMENLSSHGLNNFMNLFIVLSLSTNTIDVTKKMSSLISFIPTQNSSTDFKKSYIISIYIVLYICRYKSYNADFIIEKALSILNDITQILKEKVSSKKSMENEEIKWEMAKLSLDCFETCFTYHTYTDNDIKFLSFDYTKFLEKASISQAHMSMIIRHVEKILVHILNSDKEEVSDEVCEELFVNIYEPLRNHLKQDVHHCNIMKCIAWFALVAIDWKSPKISFGTILSKYAFNTLMSCAIRCQFLNNIFNSHKASTYIEQNELSVKVLSLWLEFILTYTEKDLTLLIDLTNKLHQLEYCKRILPKIQTDDFDADEVLMKFISSLGSRFYSAKDLFEMGEQKENITSLFKDFIKICQHVLGKNPFERIIVKRLVKVSGYLTRYCPKTIYRKTEPLCLLPQILDTFVLPLPTRPLKDDVVKMVKASFHLFLFGLSTLEFRKDEFIGRKLRQIHLEYIEYFLIESHNNSLKLNPFMFVLENVFNKGSSLPYVKSEYKQFLLEIVVKEVLHAQKKALLLASILHFLADILMKLDWQSNDFTNVILPLFDKILTILLVCERLKKRDEVEPPNVRKYSNEILLQLSKKCLGKEPIKNALGQFFITNIRNGDKTLIDVMRIVLPIFPDVRSDLLVFVEEHLEKSNLGEKFRDVLSKLKMDSISS